MDNDIEEPSSKRRRKGKEIIANVEKTISLRIHPAGFLRDCLFSLSDPVFSPNRMGMVEINDTHFQLTVRNEESNVIASLTFRAVELIDLECTKPLVPHLMFLDDIVDFLSKIDKEEAIDISHIDDPHQPQLCFEFKSESKVDVNLIKLKTDNPMRFPAAISSICRAPITRNILRGMIAHQRQNSELVSVKIKKGAVIISIGVDEQSSDWERWRIDDPSDVRAETGMHHHARFHLPHLMAMAKASVLDPYPVIFFLRNPENHILFRFRYIGFGELLFLFKALRLDTYTTLHLNTRRGVAPKPSQSGGNNTATTTRASESGNGPASGGDAPDASQSGGDATEASQSGGDATDALQSGGDATEASQPGGDAATASQTAANVAEDEASQPNGDDGSEASRPAQVQ